MNRFELDKDIDALKQLGYTDTQVEQILNEGGYWKRVDGVDENGNPTTYNLFVPVEN